MKSIHYITFNDVYNGIYQSQVIDVINHLNETFKVEVKLIAFVPLRLWKSEKNKIISVLPDAKVYPIPGSITNWKRCSFILKFIKRKEVAICRGPIAFSISNNVFNKCVYDGRAAVKAEVEEYNITGLPQLDADFINAEKFAVENANFRIAVSEKLVEYWRNDLGCTFGDSQFVVIPCTLDKLTQYDLIQRDSSNQDSINIVYSGGTGPWQSFEKVTNLLDSAMKEQINLNVIFLTKENESVSSLIKKYPTRVERKWLKHEEVFKELSLADYGILIRDKTITNRVASPVKFAEYLNAGLKVLISDEIGDFSRITQLNNLGLIVSDKIPKLDVVDWSERKGCNSFCKNNYTKSSKLINDGYQQLISSIL